MSSYELSKDAETTLKIIYKQYLKTLKSTNIQSDSIAFYDFSAIKNDINSTIGMDRFENSICELAEIEFLRRYVDGGFRINKKAIVYMENRFKKKASGIIDFISKFIP